MPSQRLTTENTEKAKSAGRNAFTAQARRARAKPQELETAGGVQKDAAEIPGGDADVREAVFLHQDGEFLWSWKLRDRCGQVGVGLLVAGDGSADAGQNAFEIKTEQSRHRAGF